jgi:hypothetical protein
LILDRQRVANTQVHHRVPIRPGRHPDLECEILIVIGRERPHRRRGDIVMDGVHQDGDGLG